MSVITVSNVEPVNKNSLMARCDVTIAPWKITLHGVCIFEKGAQRWITMPSRIWEKDGESKYIEMISFTDDATKKRFRAQVMTAIELYLQGNPNMKPEPVIKEDDELPF